MDVLRYVAARTHDLGAYRGGSSGFDDEARAFAAAHFHSLGVPATPEEVTVFCGGAKGAFMAFCAAVMCRRRHDDLHHLGGLLLTPVGYYQSLRLIPRLFGGSIHVVPRLTGAAVGDWLAATAAHPRRCVYVPLVNNADGAVLTRDRAYAIAAEVLEHNARAPGHPVYVLADDVYAGSYLDPARPGLPIAAVTGARSVVDWVARRLAIDWLSYEVRAREGIFTVNERVSAAGDWLAAEASKIPALQAQVSSADPAADPDEVLEAFRAELAGGIGAPAKPHA